MNRLEIVTRLRKCGHELGKKLPDGLIHGVDYRLSEDAFIYVSGGMVYAQIEEKQITVFSNGGVWIQKTEGIEDFINELETLIKKYNNE